MSGYERSLAKQLQYCFIISSQIHVKQSWSPDRWYSRSAGCSNERVIDRVRRWRWRPPPDTVQLEGSQRRSRGQILQLLPLAESSPVFRTAEQPLHADSTAPKLIRVEPSSVFRDLRCTWRDHIRWDELWDFDYWFIPCTFSVLYSLVWECLKNCNKIESLCMYVLVI